MKRPDTIPEPENCQFPNPASLPRQTQERQHFAIRGIIVYSASRPRSPDLNFTFPKNSMCSVARVSICGVDMSTVDYLSFLVSDTFLGTKPLPMTNSNGNHLKDKPFILHNTLQSPNDSLLPKPAPLLQPHSVSFKLACSGQSCCWPQSFQTLYAFLQNS